MRKIDNIIGKSIRGVDVLEFDNQAYERDLERKKNGETKHVRPRYICRCHFCGAVKSISANELFRKPRHGRQPEEIGCGCRKSEHIGESRRKTNSYVYDADQQCYIGTDSAGNKFLISVDSYNDVCQYCWKLDGRYFRAYIPKIKRQILLHRYVFFGLDNIDCSDKIDHINGDRYDCRLTNLRRCNHAQNMMNRKLGTNNKSGVVGVEWYKAGNKWRAELQKDHKRVYCQYFDNFDDAVKGRRDAELKYFGAYRHMSS